MRRTYIYPMTFALHLLEAARGDTLDWFGEQIGSYLQHGIDKVAYRRNNYPDIAVEIMKNETDHDYRERLKYLVEKIR